MAQTALLGAKRFRLLRTHIPATENMATVALYGALALLVVWVLLQRDRYDPSSRDVSDEMLLQASTNARLYNRPLQPWAEPGSRPPAQAGQQPTALAPFPLAVVDDGWRQKGLIRRFGPDNLYEKINGEAPKFLKQGFQVLHYLVLQSVTDGAEIAIELFDQGDTSGSLGVFSEHQSAGATIEQKGAVSYFRTSIGMIGRKDRFFFRVAGDADSQTIRDKTAQLANAFDSLGVEEQNSVAGDVGGTGGTGSAAPIDIAGVLSQSLGIEPALVTFQKQNVFQYDFVSDVWFGRLQQGADARLFVHEAATPAQAAELFAALLDEQSYEYEVLRQSESDVMLHHEFLNNHFALGVGDRFVFGVENEPDSSVAQSALVELREALASVAGNDG